MASEGGNTRLYVMVLVLTLVFPVLGFTFTNWPDDMVNYDISLDAEKLMKAGIILKDAEGHPVTWAGGYVYYNVGNKSQRASWQDRGLILGHGLSIQIPSWFGWWDPDYQWLVSQDTGSKARVVFNSTIVNEWDATYNWTWFRSEDGLNVFIQPNNSSSNITTAVYTDGVLNVTLGYALEDEVNFNFAQFVNWYMSLLLGGESYGLPVFFTWIIRIISAISVLSAILLAKDLTRL